MADTFDDSKTIIIRLVILSKSYFGLFVPLYLFFGILTVLRFITNHTQLCWAYERNS